MTPTQIDVAILGGGMAGSLLARQLSLNLSGHRIDVFERKAAHWHNVGESMVEIASNHFIRKLGLSSYLYDRQYPKNGLRFFFDSESKQTPLQEMSEIGSASIPFFPAFQIDRSRLESDLALMNRKRGITHRMGVTVEGLELGRAGEPHRFQVVDGEHREEVACRWLVDATGRTRMIAKLEDLDVPQPEPDNSSVWGWFEGVSDIDALGPESFRQRVRYAPRRLSTLHFLYRGYWIWFIPLQEGVTSIGVVCDNRVFQPEWKTPEGFFAFLRQHAAVASLLEEAKLIGSRALDHLAYGTRRFFSPDRWAVVGEASAFPDPFYSPGADFISLGNDFVADLIGRDLGGESQEAVGERTELYDQFAQFRYEAVMRLYRDQYSVFGSYEVCKLKWDLDVGCYYNLWLDAFMRDRHLDAQFLKRQLRQRDFVLTALSNFAALFRKVDDQLTAQGLYHRANRGQYSDGQDCLGFMKEIGLPRTDKQVLARTAEIFNTVYSRALDLLEGAEMPVAREPKPLTFFMGSSALDG